MITPTIGRRVWFIPSAYDISPLNDERPPMRRMDENQALDAGIVYVWGDRMVNLSVTDHVGTVHSRNSVRLLQDDETPYPGESYARWMDYQKAADKPALTEADAAADLAGTPRPSRIPFPAFAPAERA